MSDLVEIRGDFFATSEEVMRKYLAKGYWVIPEPFDATTPYNLFDCDAWEVCLDWTKDPSSPPRKGAIHI